MHVPRLVSPVTGEEEAAAGAGGYVFEPTDGNLARWRRWWKLANQERRLAADVLKTSYLPRISESRLYFGLVWGLVAIGCGILVAGFDQPLPLLVISACAGGLMMFFYSILLLVLNRKALPSQIRPRAYRIAALVWSVALFGVFSALTVWQQGDKLLDWLR